jgi:hypothetical protein
MGIFKIGRMLQTRKIESLAQVRCYIEFLLWGPKDSQFKGDVQRESNIEPVFPWQRLPGARINTSLKLASPNENPCSKQ